MKMKSGSSAISLSGIDFSWGSSANAFRMQLDAFRLDRGESAILVGPSGGGKSTLLGLICGTLVPQSGSVEVLGRRLIGLSGPGRDRFRADHIGIIFQQFNLLPYLSVTDNVLLPLQFSAKRKQASGEIEAHRRAEADRILTALGVLPETLGAQKAGTLSVGQQQRVAAARAFIGSPELIVADEPTSSLDEGRQADFLDLLFEQRRETGAALLMVSHDPRVASKFDRVEQLEAICRISTGMGRAA